MMYNENFILQVKLLLHCLPAIRNQSDFALKGGTAINLIIRELPRLSVDIDLTYCHLSNREESLPLMQNALKNIANHIRKINSEFLVKEKLDKQNSSITKLFVYHKKTMIKIEPNFIMRGTLRPVEFGELCSKVNEEFNVFLDKIPMLSLPEIYAGKICAALNRQHPRDLFDIKLLLEEEGITDDIRQTFVIYLAGDSRPIHELLAPNRLDISNIYEKEFQRMIDVEINLKDLLEVREYLIKYIQQALTENERQFLFSVKEGFPQYDLMPFEHLDQMPSLRWKEINVKRMERTKHKKMLSKLKAVLEL